MIIFRQKEYASLAGLIPFRNTFKNTFQAGKSLLHGNYKDAGKSALKAGGNALAGTGKLALGATATAGLGLYGANSLMNSVNDDEERFNYHNNDQINI